MAKSRLAVSQIFLCAILHIVFSILIGCKLLLIKLVRAMSPVQNGFKSPEMFNRYQIFCFYSTI